MSKALAGLLAVLFMGWASAADPPVATVVNLPEIQVIPAPGVVTTLSAGELYVFDSNAECVVTTSPPGVLLVTKEDGPVKIKGVFAGGAGKVETRRFAGKYVWTVDVAATGRAELLIFPAGTKDESGIVRRMIDANAGPRPPPKPDPVDPVVPVLTPFQVKLQAAFRADGATADSKAKYAALWRQAAKTMVYDPGITTTVAMLTELQTAVKLLGIPANSLNGTARVIADELNPLMPTPATGTLTKATRDAMAAIFARIAQDLEVIK
jgi:hypothetical protein